MASFSKSTNGLIYQTGFSSISDWTSNAKFSSHSELTFTSFQYLPYFINFPPVGREASIFVDGSIWYLLFDSNKESVRQASGNDYFNYIECAYAISNDRGLSWKLMGTLGPGDDNGAGGPTTNGYAMGWLAKYDSKYYLYRVLLGGPNGRPPYNGDIWSASAIGGPWTFEYALPKTPATNTAAENLPGSILKEGSTYHHFVQGSSSTGVYKIVRMHGSNPDGPFTLDNTIIFEPEFVSAETPENEKVFKYGSQFIMLFNSYDSQRAKRNYVAVSNAVDNWSGATWKRIHTECPADNQINLGNGVVTHVYNQDNLAVVGQNGFLVAVYDGDGMQSSLPGLTDYAWFRSIKTCLLEPSTHALRYTGNDASQNFVFKSLTNTNFIAEFTVEFNSLVSDTVVSFWFRNDGTSNNGYRVAFRGNNQTALLQKCISGSYTLISVGTGSQRCDLKMANRCKVIAFGHSIKVYVNGELQIDTTDASFSTGTHIALEGQGAVTADIRSFSLRTSNTVTFRGLQPGINTVLRSDCKIPVGQQYANGSGEVTYTLDHWPMETLEVEGDGDNTPVNGIWGGDVIDFTGFSTTPISKNINRLVV
jgi:hypothetical protein